MIFSFKYSCFVLIMVQKGNIFNIKEHTIT